MVLDSSALVALLLGKPEADQFVTIIAASTTRLIAAPSYLETAIVILNKLGSQRMEKVERLIDELSAAVVPFTREQAVTAIAAYARYGRGSGHPARLNFGDCFTYALAKLTGEPVLFKDNDFSQTDLPSVVAYP